MVLTSRALLVDIVQSSSALPIALVLEVIIEVPFLGLWLPDTSKASRDKLFTPNCAAGNAWQAYKPDNKVGPNAITQLLTAFALGL